MVVPTAGFGTVYATTFSGSSNKLQTLDVGGTARAASTSPNSKYYLLRNSSGDIYAQVFHGIATQAQYADLAEKYTADKEYEPGTVLVFGGEAEVTECTVFCDSKTSRCSAQPNVHI